MGKLIMSVIDINSCPQTGMIDARLPSVTGVFVDPLMAVQSDTHLHNIGIFILYR